MSLSFDKNSSRWRYEFDRLVKQPDGTTKRVRIRKAFPKNTTETQAKMLANKMERGDFIKANLIEDESGWSAYVDSLFNTNCSWIYKSLQSAKKRSASASRTFSLTPEDVKELLLESGGRCAVTGMRFNTSGIVDGKKRPLFHSLDRIDSSKGYHKDNVRIVCYAVNVAMLDWGESVFSDLCTGYVLRKYALGKMLMTEGV